MNSFDSHFSMIASKYWQLRTTDSEPICYIRDKLQNLQKIVAADVGCGAGRYVLKLFQYLGNKLYLHCIDCNESMLKELEACLNHNHIRKFQIRKSHANKLPLPSNSFDSVFTFNAVHHFAIVEFLKEVARILKRGGYLFIYTRLRSQNRRNIWGKYFPFFAQKETRLYELEEFENIVEEVPDLEMEDVKYFKYQRISSLDHLLKQAQHHHYSTFNYYTDDEFEKSLDRFNQNIRRNFSDLEHITWTDENVLLIERKHFHC